MKPPRGFGKNYFTLNAITATANLISLLSQKACVFSHTQTLYIVKETLLKSYRNTNQKHFGVNMKKSIAISLVAASLYAQNTIVLKPLLVTSTSFKTNELRSTDAVSIYTAKDIKKAHVQNIYQFLNEQTAITTMPSYGNPFAQSLDMHGYGLANGYQNIVIMLNGVRLNNIDSVPAMLSTISPSSVSRIEIIKSSGIVSAGNGANAGVINIITKTKNLKQITLYGGTYDTAAGSFYVGSVGKKLSISASGEARKFGGIRYVDSSGNRARNKLSDGRLNISYKATKKLTLKASQSFTRSDVFHTGYLTKQQYDSNIYQQGTGATRQTYNTDTTTAGADYKISSHLGLHVNTSHKTIASNYLAYNSLSEYKYNSLKASLKYNYSILKIKSGVYLFNGTRRSSSPYSHSFTKKSNRSGFIVARVQKGKSSFKAGYRLARVNYYFLDKSKQAAYTLYGATLGYNYLLTKDSSVFFNYTHAYQTPSIDDFFGFNSTTYQQFFIGSTLKPMQTDNYTLGYNNFKQSNIFKISTYYINLHNELFYYSGTPSSQNTNINRSHKYGLDFYDKYTINNHYNIALNYNYVQAIIDKEKIGNNNYARKHLPGVSNNSIKVTLSYLPNQKTTFRVTQVHRSATYATDDFGNDFTQRQAPYNSTDISFAYTQKTWQVFAKISNLFNQKNGLWIRNNDIYPVNFTTTAIAGVKLLF